jgi:hypothetical protein
MKEALDGLGGSACPCRRTLLVLRAPDSRFVHLKLASNGFLGKPPRLTGGL